MKIGTSLLLAAFLLVNVALKAQSKYEFRAVWVATVNNVDWPSKPGLTTDQQKQEALNIIEGKAKSQWPRNFVDPMSQAINYLFCDGQHKYAYTFNILENFARQAGFSKVVNYSAEHNLSPKNYFGVEVGNEVTGSLVVELYK